MRKNKIVGPLPGAGRPGTGVIPVSYKISPEAHAIISTKPNKSAFVSSAIEFYEGEVPRFELMAPEEKAQAMAEAYGISMARLHLDTYIQACTITADTGLSWYWKNVLTELNKL